MKVISRKAAVLFTALALVAGSLLAGPDSPEKPGKPVKLFNGKNLKGWVVHGTEKWYVDKGELICESGPDKGYGYLKTEKQYKDFDLSVDFLQEANGNSGVFIRSSVEGTKVSGWQVEVAGPNQDTGGIYESYGRGWLVKIPDEKEGYLKYGSWNTLRIRAQGGRVQTWLNGHEMVDFEDAKIGAANGSIALQIHDGGGIKVRWKNLLLTEL
ncbi:MAG: secreted glycosyl hydrolase [Cytophagaceae bacterium SCN 52-12]|nr:MAG: secreted glycosyl hydrolase [Cytophagaceae bacterium SCN 52-12]